MANEQRRLNAAGALHVALALLVAGGLAGGPFATAWAQQPSTPPNLQSLPDVPRRGPVDAGTVQTEVDVQRRDGGFVLQGAADEDGGTQPHFEPPVLLADSPARYPEALAARPVAGTVRLELLVDEQGEVAESRVVDSGPHSLLNDAALHASTGLRFSPARVDGVAVPVRLHFEYRFEAPVAPGPTNEPPPPPITLKGRVRAKGNRQPLVGAIIVSDLTPDAPVETGPEGRFEARLPPGLQTVRVTAPGYKPGAFYEEVRPGEALEVLYGLEPLVVNPYETVIRGDRERTEVSRVTLHDAELREIPGTQGDPFRVMMLMPGVSSMLSGVSYPVVRGSQPASTGYFLDGVRVPILFHLFLGPAVIHPDFIDTIDFYPGNPPTSYGRLTGGAVEGRLTRPRDDRVHGSAYADLLNAGLFIEYPFKSTGTNVSVAGRLSYTPWLIALLANAVDITGSKDSKLVLDFYDYQARVEQEVGPGRLRLFAFGSSDTFGTRAVTNNGFTALQSVLFHRVDLRYRHPVWGGELEAGATVGLDRFAIASESPTEGSNVLNIDQRDVIARLNYERALSHGFRLRANLDVDHKRAVVSLSSRNFLPGGEIDEVNVNLPVALATFSGLWVELPWEHDARWSVVPGLRLDNYHLAGGGDYFAVEPRLSVRHKLTEQLSLKGGVGLYHQPPTTLISLPIVDIAALSQGLQRTLQVSAGVEYKDLLGFDVSLDGYVNPMLRTVELTPFGSEDPSVPEVPELPGDGGPPGGGRPPPAPPDTGGTGRVYTLAQEDPGLPQIDLPDLSSHGLSYGLELLIRRPLGGNWFGWLSYSLQRSTRFVHFARYDTHDVPVSEAEGNLPYVFDQTHVANLVLSYKFSNNVTLGGVLHFNSGRPESGNLTSRTMVEGTDQLGLPIWVRVDRDKVDRLPPFFRFDVRLSKAWAYDTFTLEAYLDMLNVTLSQEVVSFNYDGGRGLPLRKEPLGLPIALPVLGLKGRY